MQQQRHLRQMLEELHAELQRADALDESARTLLQSVLSDIEDVLERAPAAGGRSGTITARLREAVSAFEVTHPALTEAVGRVADALAKMGI